MGFWRGPLLERRPKRPVQPVEVVITAVAAIRIKYVLVKWGRKI
jgi:hypothetical protein